MLCTYQNWLTPDYTLLGIKQKLVSEETHFQGSDAAWKLIKIRNEWPNIFYSEVQSIVLAGRPATPMKILTWLHYTAYHT